MTDNETNPTDADQWISAAIHGPRELAYQLGRLFNRFCFHVDQSNVASYGRFLDQSPIYEHQSELAVTALREIERQCHLIDLGSGSEFAPIREFRERFEDGGDFHARYELSSERCGMLESDPSVESLLDLGAQTKDWLREILLQMLRNENKAVFNLGMGVDQAVRPKYAGECVAAMRGRSEDPVEGTQAQGFGAGQLPPDSGWPQLVATLLIASNCKAAPPTEIPSSDLRELFRSVDDLDAKIRSELAPPPPSKSARLTVNVVECSAVLDNVPYKLTANGTNYLNALLQGFQKGDNDWVSSRQIEESLELLGEFKVSLAFKSLPPRIQGLIQRKKGSGSRLKKDRLA